MQDEWPEIWKMQKPAECRELRTWGNIRGTTTIIVSIEYRATGLGYSRTELIGAKIGVKRAEIVATKRFRALNLCVVLLSSLLFDSLPLFFYISKMKRF